MQETHIELNVCSIPVDLRPSVPADLNACVSVPVDLPVIISSYEDSRSESDSSEDQSDFDGTSKETFIIFGIVISVVLVCVGLYFIHINYTSLVLSLLSQELKNTLKILIPVLCCLALLLGYICKKRGYCCCKTQETRDEDDAVKRRDIAVRVMSVM